ncbi:MAG TPA: type II toxin-antitoxin system RelE/ParE family toxin [Tepidisphaeraceae bacterium]|nr:type II toxin-antitoxin system RelE/ParE family toxin [Tepidisphaeraceae bacterium]
MARVAFKPAAEADLDDAFLYIARDSMEAAVRFLARVRADCEHLAEWPGPARCADIVGRRSKWFDRGRSKASETTSCSTGRFEGGIEVIRVIHGARDVDTIVQSGE